MGFTKQEAVNEITAKFSKEVEEINQWERTIQENVESLYSIAEGKEDFSVEQFSDLVLPILRTTLGFMRKTNADVAKEKESEIKTLQQKLQTLENPAPQQDNPNDELSELKEQVSKMLKVFEEQENSKKIATITESLISKICEKGVKNQEWAKAMVSKMSVNAEMDLEKESDEIVAMYNRFLAQPTDDVPPRPGNGGKSAYSDLIESAAKSLSDREQF